MHVPRGQPPGYQRAAWAAAGLPHPPAALRGYGSEYEAGFHTGAAAAEGEARQYNETLFEITRAAHYQAAEAHAMAQHAITVLQAQAQHYNHTLNSIALLQARVQNLEEMVGKLLDDNVKLINVCRKGKGTEHQPPATEESEEPLSKRLRASVLINWKDDDWRAATSDSSA